MDSILLARVRDLATLQKKLMLLTGSDSACKTSLASLASINSTKCINVSRFLARKLAPAAGRKRGFDVAECLQDMLESSQGRSALFLNNIELLFLPTLQINPLEMLRRLSHTRPVVAIWPGTLSGGRLIYAVSGHPEYREYSTDGIVITQVD